MKWYIFLESMCKLHSVTSIYEQHFGNFMLQEMQIGRQKYKKAKKKHERPKKKKKNIHNDGWI